MFKSKKNSVGEYLFSSIGAVRDRWGEPIGATVRATEFNRFGAVDAAARLRWSLGHY